MQADKSEDKLIRGVGVTGATALNMIDMIGVGPFITMPLIVAAMVSVARWSSRLCHRGIAGSPR